MLDAIVAPFVEKLADCTIAAISRQLKYLFRYNRNIQNLRSKEQDLQNKRNDVQSLVDEATDHSLDIKSEVKAWLKKVDDLKKEADEVLKSTTNSEMQCLCLRCPNLKTRYSLSRNATKKTTAIVELQKNKFEEVGMRAHRAPLKFPSFLGSEALKTRISTKKEIINALKDTAISIVGISGMPGVGKTRMAQEVRTQVLEDKLFDEVAMVDVSKDEDIMKIQDNLADTLNLEIDKKTNEDARASQLYERLTQDNKKRILVILDGLWTDIKLEKLGIPSENCPGGLKILLTSCYEHVCQRMKALKNIKVEVLDSEEAFLFFQEIVKISNGDTQLKAIAKQVAEECKGLPLALEVVGKKLGNNLESDQLHGWRDELNRLQHSQHHEEVYSSIQLGYNHLESDEHRSFLLLCSLFPEGESIPIESLVRYARGRGLFENTETLSNTRDRADRISDTLKSCHFLLSDKEKEVKLHDVIRDFCIWVASKGVHRHMVKDDLRTEWSEHDAHESYSAISLSFQEAIELPSRLRYGNLKLLRFERKMQIPKELVDDMQEHLHFSGAQIRSPILIPNEFFDDIQELRVLHISGAQIRSPIQLPMGLRTLNLNYCTLEIKISFFGSLNKLEILTFYRSSLSTDFPRNEMVELRNLKLLDLRFNEDSCPPPPGFLFGKTKLEELYLGNYYNTSHEEKEKEHIIKELRSLKALKTLQIRTDDTQFLMQLLQACSEKLKRFEIVKNRRPAIFPRFYLYPEWQMRVWEKPFSELVQDFRINLNMLELNNLDSEYLIDAAGSFPRGIFCNLEFLELSKMTELKEMCNANFQRMKHSTRGVSQPALFCNLKDLRVYGCAKIKRMFYESVAKRMDNLQNLFIFSCQKLEDVVSVDPQENEITKLPLFPKLKKVLLRDLKSFVSFRSQPNAVGLRQTLLNEVELPDLEMRDILELGCIEKLLSVEETPFGSPNRLWIMTVQNCDNLVNIAQSNSIKLLQNLETLEVEGCRALNVIFDFEGLNVNKDDEEILGQLKSLDLTGDGNLLHITRMVPKVIRVFQNLKWLNVAYCSKLKYLFPASMINSFVALETLYVNFCDEMEEIFGREGEVVKEEGMASKIEFRELKHIELIGLPGFSMFCSHNYELVFPSLDQLRIEGCPVMKKFLSGQLKAPKLKEVLIGDDEVTDISYFFK